MEEKDIIYHNTPKDAASYRGQFIVFFTEEENPEVLFNSFIAEEAFEKAEDIFSKLGKKPVVIRVPETDKENIAQFLAMSF